MITRAAGAVAGATGVTLGLFMIMEFLVAFDGEMDLDTGDRTRFIDFSQVIEDQPPQRMERQVEKPPEPEEAPPEIETPQMDAIDPNAMNVGAGARQFQPSTDTSGINLGPSADGDMLPLVQPPIQPPRRALERGLSGYCQVSLTVLEDGTVDPDSVVGVEEKIGEKIQERPNGMFCRAAVRGVAKYKYKPRVVNGTAQKVHNVGYRVQFRIEEAR